MPNPFLQSLFKPVKSQPTKWTLAFLLLASTLILMGGAAVAPALPLIGESFPDASEMAVSLIITLPSLAIVFSGFFVGSLADRGGRLPVLSASLLIFTIAGVSGFFLNSLLAILAGRFILGIGIAGITVTTTALISDYYSGMTRTKVFGYQGASMGIGVLILETSGGFLAGISWRMAFLIYLIGLVILIGVLATMKEPIRQLRPLPPVTTEKDAATRGETTPKLSLKTAQEPTPVFEISLIYLTLFMSMVMFFLMPTKLPYLIIDILTSTGLLNAGGIFANPALLSGLFLGLMGCFTALVGLFYWRIAGQMHRTLILAITYLMLCVGFITLGFSDSLLMAGISVIIIGTANGLIVPTLLNWLMSVTPREIIGKVTGGYSVSLNMGQFLSSLVVVPVFAVVGTYANLYIAYSIPAALLGVFYIGGYLKTRVSSPKKPSPQRY